MVSFGASVLGEAATNGLKPVKGLKDLAEWAKGLLKPAADLGADIWTAFTATHYGFIGMGINMSIADSLKRSKFA